MALPPEEFTVDGMMAAYEESDYEKMSEIRTRVDAIVSDADTAAALKAWYRQLCKRPCFHDEYLQSFNGRTRTWWTPTARACRRSPRPG